MSPDARDRHAELPGKRYASVLFSSFFLDKDQSMNQFLGFFFLSPTKDCIFFFLKTQKKSHCLTVSHEEGRLKKKKKSEEGNKRGDAYLP